MENASRAFLDAVRKSMRHTHRHRCDHHQSQAANSRRAPPV
jgi:hypothetical protein